MTHHQSTGNATEATPFAQLGERENARALERIENAERSAPYCMCGNHMVAVVRGESVWLECSSHRNRPDGIRGFIASISYALGHNQSRIMDLPTTE